MTTPHAKIVAYKIKKEKQSADTTSSFYIKFCVGRDYYNKYKNLKKKAEINSNFGGTESHTRQDFGAG